MTFVSQSFDGQKQVWIRGNAITQTQFQSTVVSGDGVPIMWQSKDAEVLARAVAMTPTVQSNTITSTSEAKKPSVTSEVPGFSSPDGLSTGVKIGLGVGIPIAFIAGLALGLLLWKRRRGHKIEHERGLVDEQSGFSAEYKVTPAAPMHYAGEQVHELRTRPEAYHSRHELPGVALQS
jgi:hypothetical protein